MSLEANREIVRRYVEDVWGKGDVALAEELLADDFVDHNPHPGAKPNKAAHNEMVRAFASAFPDRTLTLKDLVADGDRVVDHWMLRATHQGEFFGIPATGRSFTVDGIDIVRLEDGRIKEVWHIEDIFGLPQQLGVVPTREPAAVA